MVATLSFIAPSLHPNTLIDAIVPLHPGADPIIKNLAIKYGDYKPAGLSKRLAESNGHIVIADDQFRLSSIKLPNDEQNHPEVVAQYQSKPKKGDTWAGMVPVQGGFIATQTSGLATFFPHSTSGDGEDSAMAVSAVQTASLPSPLLCMASSSNQAKSFVIAGKEVDISIFDIERVFSSGSTNGNGKSDETNGKRKKNDSLPGEIWRAKNLPPDHLDLRRPIHHLSLAYLPESETDIISGTKAGTIRRYDTRQRKPVSDWKLAKEGGIGCVSPGYSPHELFYADRTSQLGSLDLRTGKMIYLIPSNATIHSLVSIPPCPSSTSTASNGGGIGEKKQIPGLASISSDATLRIHHSTPPPTTTTMSNWNKEIGKKGGTISMVGGVGMANMLFRGWGSMDLPKESNGAVREGENGEERGSDEEEDDDDDDGEDVWDGLDQVGEDGDGSDEEIDSDSEDEAPTKKSKRRK